MNVTSRFASWRAVVAPVVLLAGAALLSGCPAAAAHTPQTGQELYASCTTCHGANGEGQAYIAAPAIAGLPRWYVESTVKKFRTGLRGAHPDDIEGLRMRPMSRQMASDSEVAIVSAYVAAMPKTAAPPHTLLGGDAAAGANAYAVCSACHGPNGMGNEALKAPPIAGQADWYLLSSLKKFKSGVRGAAPGDISGSQMRPMAGTLADEQAMKNVIAHINTLSGR